MEGLVLKALVLKTLDFVWFIVNHRRLRNRSCDSLCGPGYIGISVHLSRGPWP